jgi:hypothetical protein
MSAQPAVVSAPEVPPASAAVGAGYLVHAGVMADDRDGHDGGRVFPVPGERDKRHATTKQRTPDDLMELREADRLVRELIPLTVTERLTSVR